MNTENKVFNKLFSEEKVELASQKYEFAKKVPQILSEVQKIDDALAKSSLKMNDISMAYSKAYADFLGQLDNFEKLANTSENDLVSVMDSLQAIGMDPKEAQKITGFTKAADLVTRIKELTKKFRTLYKK